MRRGSCSCSEDPLNVYAWQGLERPLFEVAFVDVRSERLRAEGTQLGDGYRLEYALETSDGFVSERLQLDCRTARGMKTLDLRRGAGPLAGEVLDVDLGFSPLFNSLPVLRDGLHEGGGGRDYVMAWVAVPELSVSRSRQRYLPLERGVVRFRSGSFTADVEFDADGFVVRYPGLAERVS
jgi:uncharacterized protein